MLIVARSSYNIGLIKKKYANVYINIYFVLINFAFENFVRLKQFVPTDSR